MTTYTFRDTTTNELVEHIMKMSELDQFKLDNTHLERALVDAPSFGDPVRLGIKRIDNGFREVLSRVAEKTPGGKMLNDNIR